MRPRALSFVALALAALGAVGSALAQPCSTLSNPTLVCPHITPDAAGNMFYDPINEVITFNARPFTLSLCIPNTDFPGAPIATCNPSTSSLTIRVRVDHDGNIIPGTSTPTDLIVKGSFPGSFGGTCAPPAFSGVLLTGEVLSFGYNACTDCPPFGCTSPGRCVANFDFVFRPTGGALASLFAGKNIAAVIASENNSFGGLDCNNDGAPDRFTNAFNSKFGTKVDLWGTPAPTACCNPDDGSCVLAPPGESCPPGTIPTGSDTCEPTTCPRTIPCCNVASGQCQIFTVTGEDGCPAGFISPGPGITTCTPTVCCPSDPTPPTIAISFTPEVAPCPCDEDGSEVVDSTDLMTFLNNYFNGSADYNGDGSTTPDDLFQFLDCYFVSSTGDCGSFNGADVCPSGDGKIKSLTLQYTGEDCSATSHTQDPSKVSCNGDPASDPLVFIRATEKSNPNDLGGKIWFQGSVPLGGSFVASAANGNASELKADTYVHIFASQGGPLLQSIKFHTSCSQPLKVGDRFGALRVADFEKRNGRRPERDSDGNACERFEITYDAERACPDPLTVTATIEADCLPPRSIPSGQVVEVCCPEPPTGGDLCDTVGGKITTMTFRYTAADCSASMHHMDPSKVTCTGTLNPGNSPATVFVQATASTSGAGPYFFSGSVALNDEFTVLATNGGVTQLPTNTFFYIYSSQGGTLLQKVGVHTSCSQPIFPGDQFGSLFLLSYATTAGGPTSLPVQCSFDDSDPLVLKITAENVTITVTASNAAGDVLATETEDITCPPPPPTPRNVCADGKPNTLTFLFTGEDCSATMHTQDPSKVSCSGTLSTDNAPATVFIRVSDKSDPTDSRSKIWFQGNVALGSEFTAAAANGNSTRFAADSYAHIFETQGGRLLQTIKFHTSCSQPLNTGNQFGSLRLTNFTIP